MASHAACAAQGAQTSPARCRAIIAPTPSQCDLQACQKKPPNCFCCHNYKAGQSDINSEGDETIFWHNDLYAPSGARVSQCADTAVLSISIGADVLMQVRKHKNKLAVTAECGPAHTAAVLESGSCYAWLPCDDGRWKHSPKFPPRAAGMRPCEKRGCACRDQVRPSVAGGERWAIVCRWVDTRRRHSQWVRAVPQ